MPRQYRVITSQRALARRSGPRVLPAPYRIDEDAELAAVRRSAHVPLRELAGQARHSAGESARGKVQSGARALIGRTSDRRLERLFGSRQAQRAVFALLAGRFDPAHAGGFEGLIRDGIMTLEGDLGLARRMAEMFGSCPAY
jgi:hypothetical protein